MNSPEFPSDSTPAITPSMVNAAVAELWTAKTGQQLCTEVSPVHAVGRLEVSPESIRPGGFVSGPTQFGLADAVLWYLTFGVLGRVEPMALTSELSIRYLRPAQGKVLWAHADLEKAGRTSIVGTVRLWMDDQPDRRVSAAQGTYALPR